MVVVCALQTSKKLVLAKIKDDIGFIEGVNQALRVKRFTIRIGQKLTALQLPHGRKPSQPTKLKATGAKCPSGQH